MKYICNSCEAEFETDEECPNCPSCAGSNVRSVKKFVSKETKKKMSISQKKRMDALGDEGRKKIYGKIMRGKTSPMKGKKMSEETKLKLKMCHLGKTMSAETRKKMSEAAKRRNKDNGRIA